MSIGKNSIARAVNATATKVQSAAPQNAVSKFASEQIGLLSVAKLPDNVGDIKQSISKRGILCPLLVAVTAKGDVWLLDGYRRYFAAKELGMSQLSAVVISVENKTEANRIYAELSKLEKTFKADNVREEKFRVIACVDHDLPAYLL